MKNSDYDLLRGTKVRELILHMQLQDLRDDGSDDYMHNMAYHGKQDDFVALKNQIF
jgi:hypothetical protein